MNLWTNFYQKPCVDATDGKSLGKAVGLATDETYSSLSGIWTDLGYYLPASALKLRDVILCSDAKRVPPPLLAPFHKPVVAGGTDYGSVEDIAFSGKRILRFYTPHGTFSPRQLLCAGCYVLLRTRPKPIQQSQPGNPSAETIPEQKELSAPAETPPQEVLPSGEPTSLKETPLPVSAVSGSPARLSFCTCRSSAEKYAFLIGKVCRRTVTDGRNEVLFAKNSIVRHSSLLLAEKHGKLLELALSCKQ